MSRFTRSAGRGDVRVAQGRLGAAHVAPAALHDAPDPLLQNHWRLHQGEQRLFPHLCLTHKCVRCGENQNEAAV